MAAILVAAALALLVLPGAAICAAAGLRGWASVAAGPALTLAVVAVGCAVTAAADVPWNPASAGVTALVALLGAGAVGVAARVAGGRGRARGTGVGAADDESDDDEPDDDEPDDDKPDDDEPAEGESGTDESDDDDEPGTRDLRADAPDTAQGAHGRRAGARDVSSGSRRADGRLAGVVVVLLSLLPALQVLVATRGLAAIPQNWDAVFHGGATRYIAETGRAGLTDLAPVSQPANPHFYYPDSYHALVSLLLHLPGDGTPGALNGLPGALNAMSAATGVVFVLGVAVLAGRLTGGSRLAAVAAAVVAASCWVFPYQTLGWGPLLPYSLGVAVIPGVLVLGERLAARRPGGPRGGRVVCALLLGVALTGAWALHPSAALSVAIPLVVQAVAGIVAAPGRRARLAVAGGFGLAALVASVYALWSLSVIGSAEPDADFAWPRHMGVGRAVAGVFDLGPSALASAGITVLVLIGLAAAVTHAPWRRPLAAMVVALAGYGTLYVLAAGVREDWVRMFTGFWWDDMYRFSALLALPSAVLAGAGARALVPRGSLRGPAARLGTAVVTVCLLAAASGQALLGSELRLWGYGDGPAVTAQEREILDRLAERHDGGVVLGDPFDGTAWVYALHGVPVVFGAPLADDPVAQVGADRMTLYTSVNRYGFDPSVTYEVQRQDVRWVVVGTGAVGGPGRPGGFIGLDLNPHLRLVEENEGARLYEVLPVPADHPTLLPPAGIPAVTPPWQPPNTDSPVVDAVPPGPGTNLGGTG